MGNVAKIEAAGTRSEIVRERTQALNELSDKELIATVVTYFDENSTMPGEKDIKDRAAILLDEMEKGTVDGVTNEIRRDMIEEFASLAVKEVKVQGTKAMNETKKNKDSEDLKASDLPMVLKNAQPTQVNNMTNVYELPVFIGGEGSVRIDEGERIGTVPEGFKKNHPNMEGMRGTVIATDHSNGKFANMNYSLIIDLCQNMEGDNSFTRAVESIVSDDSLAK